MSKPKIERSRRKIERFRRIGERLHQLIAHLRRPIERNRAKSIKSEQIMKRQHPDPRMSMPISHDIYQKLCSASMHCGFAQEDWEIAETAIREWVVRNAPDTLELERKSGYQWKDVFLPSGSLLRTVFEGRNHHCHVEGDRLLFQGGETSPNRFIQAVGGVRRSAWRAVWVLLHGTSTWTLAADLRRLHALRRNCL